MIQSVEMKNICLITLYLFRFCFTYLTSFNQYIIQKNINKYRKNHYLLSINTPYEEVLKLKYALSHVINSLTIYSLNKLSNQEKNKLPDTLYISLEEKDSIYYINYSINNNMFRAIVDTGSPFLLAPSICTRTWGGCYNNNNKQNELFQSTLLEDTTEIYGGQNYDVIWKKGSLQFKHMNV